MPGILYSFVLFMPLQSPSPLPVADVPPNLAVLAGRKNYLWHETPALQEATATMKDLCHSVVQALYENCSQASVLREHHAVTTDAVYTLLKEGELSLTGKRKPDEVGRNVRNRLEMILRRNGAVALEKDHPFATYPDVATRKTVKGKNAMTSYLTSRATEKTEYVLRTKPGFQQAIQMLKDHDCLRRLAEERLPEMLRPGERTVVSLPRKLLAVLDAGDRTDDEKRPLLIETIGEFCNRRNERLGKELENAGRYMGNISTEGTPDDDYMALIVRRALSEAARSPQAEWELRSLLMAALFRIAYEPPPVMRSGGQNIATEQILRLVTSHDWPAILDRRQLATPPELELAKLAVISRCDPLDEVRETILSLERSK